MAEQQGTLQTIGTFLAEALRPLQTAFSGVEQFKGFMLRLGWRPTDLPAEYTNLVTTISAVVDKLDSLGDDPSPNDILDLVNDAVAAFNAVRSISTAPPGVDAGAFLGEIAERLFELLLTDYLAAEQPSIYNLLRALNVITLERHPAAAGRPAFARVKFDWAALPKIISDPGSIPQQVFGWGTPDLDAQKVIDYLAALFFALKFPARVRVSDDATVRAYTGGALAPVAPTTKTLNVTFYSITIAGNDVEAGFRLRPLPASGSQLPGFALEPLIPSQFPLTLQLADDIALRLLAGANVPDLFGLVIRPDGAALVYPFAPGTPPPSAGIGIGFDFTPADPVILLGEASGTRLQFKGGSIDLSTNVGGAGFEIALNAQLSGLALILSPEEGDGFIRKVIGDSDSTIAVPLGVEWSNLSGIRFKGSAAFEVSLHPHLQLGPLRVEVVTISLSVPSGGPPRISLKVTAGISGALGPLKFLVQGIGLATDVIFQPGNAGPFGIGLGFKPPDGIGLDIDAGGFIGGGFLILDEDKGEYSGGLDLMFEDGIAVHALAILDTKLPDGGFSLLILISSEFPAIPLPFGFKLLGVGGLLGLNRSVALEALAAGLRDDSFQTILFPTDVVANAPQIISNLNRLFPQSNGHFIVGPMAKLGWATPTLVTAEVGLVLDLPTLDIAFVGVVRAALPADDIAILTLQVNFFGTLDFKTGRLQFDASLYDSHILGYTLTGDMAFRFYWLDDANLLLTAGGFNPAYTPPPMNLPQLSRISIVLFEGNPDVRAEGYFAVTSNTVQFGARIELNYGVHGFSVSGFLSLDAVVTLIPFHFTSDAAAMLAVRSGSDTLFSISLELTLEGPLPWHAHGTASFEIGFVFTITISVSFDITVGPSLATLLAPIDVLAELLAALSDLGNWRSRLPDGSNQAATLRPLPDPTQTLVVQPFGLLDVSQKVSPLAIAIQRFGATTPQGGSVFQIVDVALGGQSIDAAATEEEFAPAQFFAMSDAEKLSRPSFSKYNAGISIGGEQLPAADFMHQRDVAYEVIYLPEHAPVRVKFGMPPGLSQFSMAGAAVAQSPLSQARRAPSPLGDRVSVDDDRYVVVSAENLGLFRSDLVFDTVTAADLALRGLFSERPELTGTIQVMPAAAVPHAGAP